MSLPLDVKIQVGLEQCEVKNDPPGMGEMYGSAAEIVALIKAALTEAGGKTILSARTLESGVVEENAIVSVEEEEKQLMLRMWPVFFSYDKRVEYRIYTQQNHFVELIDRHLKLFASACNARLVDKNQ